MNGDIEKDPLAIEETTLVKPENLKVENEMVAMDKGTIKGSTKNFFTKSINYSLNDGIISENSIECNCAYSDVTIENLIENISSENKLLEQKGKELDLSTTILSLHYK
ncbi:uncharacterized protein LOC142328117 isoform X2 [Lycorma delicatula]|uniref:uncharacterized protein LOC142328117 isoform X2 n=1 Tax=Lycorma delicatula TaxID=130591 RepID=UPI003F5193AB